MPKNKKNKVKQTQIAKILKNEKGYVLRNWYFMKFKETFDSTTANQMYICGDVFFNGKSKIYRQIPVKRIKNIEKNNEDYMCYIKNRTGAREMELITAAKEAPASNNMNKIEVINKMAKLFEMDQILVSPSNMDGYFKKQKHLKDRQDTILNKLEEYLGSKYAT